MKKTSYFLSLLFATSLLAACSVSDSETLKRARSIQQETLSGIHTLDSSLFAKIEAIKLEITTLSADSLIATDSLKMKSLELLKEKQIEINTAKNQLEEWKGSLNILPSTEEIASGAANPFGEKTKDQEVLSAIKNAQEELNSWKSKVSSLIQ